jgi:hypothetical protein
MSRITHCAYFPLNIDYWDYYILCGPNIEAACILQRLECWDGTKSIQLWYNEARVRLTSM